MQDKYPPIAGNQDPWTSHAAGDAITKSGLRQTQMERCLGIVQDSPGLVAGEIGELTGLGHVPAQRRLSDLKNLGHIVQGTARQWQGRAQVTWWPPDAKQPIQPTQPDQQARML